MIESIANAIQQTWVVTITFILALGLTLKKSESGFFPKSTTNALKGLAILFVVLSHIGYFLVNDHDFLQPLSNYAGVGVDLFLILSGYGLTMSALQKPLSRLQFYKKRLFRLYVPIALTIVLFIITDAALLHHTYQIEIILKNLLGFFPSANLYQDINSPLWFITLLLFFYLLFPLIFQKRAPLLSATVLGMISWWLSTLNLHTYLPITEGVASLYRVHFMAFPIGMFLGGLVYNAPHYSKRVTASFQTLLVTKRWVYIRTSVCVLACGFLYYVLGHSAVGQGWRNEEVVSVITALTFMVVFIASPVQSRVLALLGAYSFEVYLLHWPLLYRYNFLYGYVPAGVATILYVILFTILAMYYQKAVSRLFVRT